MSKIILSFFCYKINVSLVVLILISSSYEYELINLNETKKQLNEAVYFISTKNYGLYNNLLFNRKEEIFCFSNRYENSMKNIRIIPIKNEESVFYFELIKLKMFIGINETKITSLALYNNKTLFNENRIKLKWKLYPINDKEFLIQSLFTNKFWRTKILLNLECSGDIKFIRNKTLINSSMIDNEYLFKIEKLYDEVKIKEQHMPIIEKEPIDILIKYIDLNDSNLQREGIKQIKKDEDNGELKYCLRSIFKFIPWFRKIFILMPNEKVSFLKPKEEINDRIIYIKDKDLLGFDSESSTTFQYVLFKLKKFGISDNFILMDDDYFIGRELKKTDFFYYDKDKEKVVPIIISKNYNYYKVQENELKQWIYYSLQMNYQDYIISHTSTGWKATKSRGLLFLKREFNISLTNAGFDHNAIPVNIEDIEELYNLIYLKYKYSFLTLNSNTRTRYDMQYQTLYATYALNKLKRKVKPIISKFYDVKNVDDITLGYGLFCVNTGYNVYEKSDFDKLKNKLNELFPEKIEYEI